MNDRLNIGALIGTIVTEAVLIGLEIWFMVAFGATDPLAAYMTGGIVIFITLLLSVIIYGICSGEGRIF